MGKSVSQCTTQGLQSRYARRLVVWIWTLSTLICFFSRNISLFLVTGVKQAWNSQSYSIFQTCFLSWNFEHCIQNYFKIDSHKRSISNCMNGDRFISLKHWLKEVSLDSIWTPLTERSWLSLSVLWPNRSNRTGVYERRGFWRLRFTICIKCVLERV